MTFLDQRQMMSEFYQRKLYALLPPDKRQNWQCFSDVARLEQWWRDSCGGIAPTDENRKDKIHLAEAIASSSDRVNLTEKSGTWNKVRHPISAEKRSIDATLAWLTDILSFTSKRQ